MQKRNINLKFDRHAEHCPQAESCWNQVVCILTRRLTINTAYLDCWQHGELYDSLSEVLDAYREKLIRENCYAHCICWNRKYDEKGRRVGRTVPDRVGGVCIECRKPQKVKER